MANCQEGDEISAKIFYESNIVTKVFFTLKTYSKYKKVVYILNKVMLRFGYNRLLFSWQKGVRKEYQVERHL